MDDIVSSYTNILTSKWKKSTADLARLCSVALESTDKRVSADAMYDSQVLANECDVQKLLFAAERYWESEMEVKLYNGVSFDECVLLMNDCFERILAVGARALTPRRSPRRSPRTSRCTSSASGRCSTFVPRGAGD